MQGKQSVLLYLALIKYITGGFNTDFCGDDALDTNTEADEEGYL